MPEFLEINGAVVPVPIDVETADRATIQKFYDDQVKPAGGAARVTPSARPSVTAPTSSAPTGTE